MLWKSQRLQSCRQELYKYPKALERYIHIWDHYNLHKIFSWFYITLPGISNWGSQHARMLFNEAEECYGKGVLWHNTHAKDFPLSGEGEVHVLTKFCSNELWSWSHFRENFSSTCVCILYKAQFPHRKVIKLFL